MPPDAPDPRVRPVRQQLGRAEQHQKRYGLLPAGQNVLNRGVPDALGVVVSKSGHQNIEQNADNGHPEQVLPVVTAAHAFLKKIFKPVDGSNEQRRQQPGQYPARHKPASTIGFSILKLGF